MGQETYSVAALAAALGVPRTTVNDWLSKYENFIECTSIGKRKVYPAQTLAVLQEVVRLRDMGRSGVEIEQALEQSHGVTPEIAPEKKASENPAPEAEKSDSAAEETLQAQLPAIKKFEENAMELTAFIADLRKDHLQSKKRSRRITVLLFCVIILLVAALLAAVQAVRMQFAERQFEYAKTLQTLNELNREFNDKLKQQEELRRQDRKRSEEMFQNERKRSEQLLQSERKRSEDMLQNERNIRERREKMFQNERKRSEDMLQNERKRSERIEQMLQKERQMLQRELEYRKRSEQMMNTRVDVMQKQLVAANQALEELKNKSNAPAAAEPASGEAPAKDQTPAGAAGK